ncbi:cytochrome P450 [Acidiferrimicrobium sp. IK]|uniref:cytochrome P450 n=1 Tax=Acidiferrimicrobium sp. IK TaxID=2871700 RepID=UPI0021CB41B3|nr:cytochrome P450 [Acidiferrimicrobium sp. IK]MCU4187455.1 cytochrome P450 [Acidiferrimicrobium sp. IK]
MTSTNEATELHTESREKYAQHARSWDTEIAPVTDWATDFEVLDPDYVLHPEERWAEQRERCPIAFTERRQRSWLPVRSADLQAIAQDVEHFSSRDIAVVSPFEGHVINDIFPVPPISSDAPVHTWARRLLLPAFGPSAIEKMTPITRALASSLIEEHFSGGSGDAAADYARHIPVRIIATMLGIPLEDEEIFTGWVVRTLQEGFQNIDRAMDALGEMTDYFAAKVAERRSTPEAERPDDVLSMLIAADTEQPMTDEHLLGTCFLLLIAGIDTTWSAIGSSLWHLATHPEDQQRLRDEPDLIPLAVEEFLRVYSPVTMARYVTDDVEFKGCPMKKGDKVLMAFPAGNRDPELFEDPDEVVIDRRKNRHAAFGMGIHRCLGSNLARMEIKVAIEAFLDNVPTFELADPEAVRWNGGQVRGPRCVPIRF